MNEIQAEALAIAIGGEAWQSGGNIWLVTVHRADGALVVFSGDAVCEYETEEAFDQGRQRSSILLATSDDDAGWWAVTDGRGRTVYRDSAHKLGWRWREDAEEEASALESKTGIAFTVERLD